MKEFNFRQQLKNSGRNSKRIALKDDKQKITYGELLHEINIRAQQLTDVTTLGIAMDNSVEWVLWDLAALVSNIACVPLPPFFSETQIQHSVKSAGITHIVSNKGLEASLVEANKNIPQGTAKITYTSGTTSEPKGVCLSEQAMVRVAKSIVDLLGNDFVGNHLCVLPLAVLLENVAGVYAGLIAGCSIHLESIEQFDKTYTDLHETLFNNKTNSIILVPEILRLLMMQVRHKGNLPDLKFVAVGGSKISSELLKQAQLLGLPVYEGYGLSECGSVVSLNAPESQRLGSVGKLLPHVKASISDGEIIITDPGFLGYLGETSHKVFATGDIGEFDKQGYLSITGRKKNILITTFGRNVSPEWIESLLLSSPDIAQAIVIGDSKASLGALIVPISNKQSNSSQFKLIEATISQLNQQLPDYAQVKNIHFVEPFTLDNKQLTGTGRPRRSVILDHYKHLTENSYC